MNVGATGGLPAQPATWGAGPNNGGGVTLIDPQGFGFIVQGPMAAGPGVNVLDSVTDQFEAGLTWRAGPSGGSATAIYFTPDNGVTFNFLWLGAGAPLNANGSNGDIYLRTDTPAVANQRIYVKSAGVWVGIL